MKLKLNEGQLGCVMRLKGIADDLLTLAWVLEEDDRGQYETVRQAVGVYESTPNEISEIFKQLCE